MLRLCYHNFFGEIRIIGGGTGGTDFPLLGGGATFALITPFIARLVFVLSHCKLKLTVRSH